MKKIVKSKSAGIQEDSLPSVRSSLSAFNQQQVATTHPKYNSRIKEWTKVRDCMEGEDTIKGKLELYLPRPEGMDGKYRNAYESYRERAHFPLICPYALQGALGVIITKLPEFNVPKEIAYILDDATKDGRSLQQLFVDVLIEIFMTGRVPIAVDVVADINQFRFVQYKAEDMINWKSSLKETVKSVVLATFKEAGEETSNVFSHLIYDIYRVLHLEVDPETNEGIYMISIFNENKNQGFSRQVIPTFMGKTLDEIPLVLAGSINNNFNIQPIPLISVANCSIQIYRKEADLANSEFLSCNPTLVVTGAINDGNLPNVVGSSVMIVIPNELANVFYTKTDTAALEHVSGHIKDLYEEAIRHGVSILDARKGVEAAEALRIRQATQSASIYSIYLSAMNALVQGLKMMCKWYGLDPNSVVADAPTSLTFGIPDSALVKELVAGFAESGVIPIEVVHKYLVSSGLLEQTISLDDYLKMLEENKKLKEKLGIKGEKKEENTEQNGVPIKDGEENGSEPPKEESDDSGSEK